MNELNLLPFEFIEEVCWSFLFDGKVSFKYEQVENLRTKRLENSDFAKISKEPNTYLLRWILKDEVYQYFKDNNISVDLLVIRNIDFSTIDYAVPVERPPRPDNLMTMTAFELDAFKNQIHNHRRACELKEQQNKYSHFPLYANISKEQIIMLKLML